MTESFYVVAALDDLTEGQQMHVELDGEDILLCRHQNAFFAVAYYCSHAALELDGGLMDDNCIMCPHHGARFDLRDGSVQGPPAFEGIKTYPVKIENNTIAISAVPKTTPQD